MITEYSALASTSLKTGSTFARPTQSLPERIKLGNPAIDALQYITRQACPAEDHETRAVPDQGAHLSDLRRQIQTAGILIDQAHIPHGRHASQ